MSALRLGGFMLLVLFGLPLYWFFGYCPEPTELLKTRRQIRVGMTVEEAEMRMPADYSKASRRESKEPLRGQPKGKGFTGYIRQVEDCSVQCTGRLEIECRDGIVMKVSLELYNDLNHSSREIK